MTDTDERDWPRVFLLHEGLDIVITEPLAPDELAGNHGDTALDVAAGKVVDGARLVVDLIARTAIVRTESGDDILHVAYWPDADLIPDAITAVMEPRLVAKAKLYELAVVTRHILGSKTRGQRFLKTWRWAAVADYVVATPEVIDEQKHRCIAVETCDGMAATMRRKARVRPRRASDFHSTPLPCTPPPCICIGQQR